MKLGSVYYQVAAALSIRGKNANIMKTTKKCQHTENDKTEILNSQTLLQFTETIMQDTGLD